MGMGIIARDVEGRADAAMCASKPFITDLATAEAMVALKLAGFSHRFGFTQIIVEGDSKEIVLAIQREGECKRGYGHFVEETKSLLNQLGA
jgi:hypothetical protein